MRTESILLSLISSSITGESLSDSLFSSFSHSDWQSLYALAKKHDLAHLVGDVLLKHHLLPEAEAELSKKFSSEALSAVFRTQRMAGDLAKLRQVFNEAEIPYIFLKGSVIRTWYPEAWMRTSADIDILVRQEDLLKAKSILEGSLSYEFSAEKSDHDISAFGPSKVHLELHYKLIEGAIQGQAERVLSAPWTHATPTGSGSEWAFSDEFFYYYFIAHTSKHFVHGGCGVRPLIDLWVMRQKLPEKAEKRRGLLDQGGLMAFAEQLELLSEVWFEGAEHSAVTKKMEEYIFDGGVYGNAEQYAAMSHVREGNRFRHILQRIWLPRRYLICEYPILEKHPVLIPACQFARWTRLFTGRGSAALRELKMNARITDTERAQAQTLLEDLGL